MKKERNLRLAHIQKRENGFSPLKGWPRSLPFDTETAYPEHSLKHEMTTTVILKLTGRISARGTEFAPRRISMLPARDEDQPP